MFKLHLGESYHNHKVYWSMSLLYQSVWWAQKLTDTTTMDYLLPRIRLIDRGPWMMLQFISSCADVTLSIYLPLHTAKKTNKSRQQVTITVLQHKNKHINIISLSDSQKFSNSLFSTYDKRFVFVKSQGQPNKRLLLQNNKQSVTRHGMLLEGYGI